MKIDEAVQQLISRERPSLFLKEYLEQGQREESEEEIQQIIKNADPLVFACVFKQTTTLSNALSLKELSVDDYYEELWSMIPRSEYFSFRETVKVALLALIKSPAIPYIPFQLVTMDDEEFASRREKLENEIMLLERITNIKYLQFTQQASALIEVISPIEDKRDRAVLLAAVIRLFETKSKQAAD